MLNLSTSSLPSLSKAAVVVTLAGSIPACAATVIPDFSNATFEPGHAIDNPYFPLGPTYVATIQAQGIDEDGRAFTERSDLSFGGPGRVILGVQTTVQRDLAFENGRLIEDTLDYYAQDTHGNVWYMGEDVVNYVYDDDGTLLETNNDSAWIAGQNGAQPGWIMPAQPVIGLAYFQEVAPNDDALDEAQIWATDLDVIADGRLFQDVLAVFESTTLDPDAREFKYYALGIGLIRVEEGLDPNFANPEVVFEITEVAPIPLPGTLYLMFGALAGAATLRLRTRRRGA